MKTFAINTLGCKVNQYESQQIRQILEQLGLKPSPKAVQADLFVVNTCCVTHTASAKSRQMIKKARKANPAGKIVVVGCLSADATGELVTDDEELIIVADKRRLAQQVAMLSSARSQADADTADITISNPSETCPGQENSYTAKPLESFAGQTRAFIKVQDGCDAGCAYCIIPKTRPKVRSRTPEQVIFEAKLLVKAGHREIVVTGVHLGAFGQAGVRRCNWDQNHEKLADLLEKLAQIPDLERIRLSSLWPGDLTEKLLQTIKANPNIMPHLHLSLQSGSNTVLGRMGRKYTAQQYLRKVQLARKILTTPAITTDIIAGFPGETDHEFEQTVNMAKIAAFAKIHVFPFSPRKGTAAATMPGKVPSEVITARTKKLRQLDQRLQFAFRDNFVGKTAQVLVEKTQPVAKGRTPWYFEVSFEASHVSKGQIVPVEITENKPNGAVGRLAGEF